MSIARVISVIGPPYAATVSQTPTNRMVGRRLCAESYGVRRRSRSSAADHAVAEASGQPGRPLQAPRQERLAERPVGLGALPLEIGFVVRAHETLRRDQGHDDAGGERAAAETEGVDVVAVPVVAAGVSIDVQDVPFQAPAEGAAERRQRLERRRADAVVVIGDLRPLSLCRRSEVDRLVHSPDVGLEQFGAAVPGAVGEEDDRFALRGHDASRQLAAVHRLRPFGGRLCAHRFTVGSYSSRSPAHLPRQSAPRPAESIGSIPREDAIDTPPHAYVATTTRQTTRIRRCSCIND